MSFDLKAFVKKSWDTFRGGDTTIGIGQWQPNDGLLALLNKPELVAGLIPHIPEYISDLTTSSTEELSDKANELLGLDPGTLTADNLGVFLGYIRDETPEAFNSVLAELTGTTPLEVFQAVYEYSSKKAVDSLGLDGVPTNTTDPKWYVYFDELQNILGAGGRSREEAAEDYFRQAGYEPSPEELEEILMGDAFPTRTAIEVYVDPRQVTNDEVIERLERLGVDVEGQAEAAGQTPEEYAEQIKQSVPPGDGSEAAFDDAMIMSLTSTAAGSTGSASFKEALSKMGTGVKNLLFGTNSGRPKPWLQILKEQIEKRYFPTFEDKMPGFPIALTFDLDGASAANPTGAVLRLDLKIPVPFPINGPPIIIPIFDVNGNYVGPTTPEGIAGLIIDPETGVIAQVVDGVKQTVAQIKGEAVQILGAAGDVIRSFPLGLLENPDWKEGDPNPFELEVDENGDIAPQTDENGNPATGYDPDTGMPVYQQLDEEEEEAPVVSRSPYEDGSASDAFRNSSWPDSDEEDPVVSRSPYEDGSASDAFRNSSWPDPDPDAQDTYSSQIEEMFLTFGLDTNQWPEGTKLNISTRDGQPVDANEDGVYTVEELAAVGITRAAGYDPRMFLGNDARLVLDTLEGTLDGLGLDVGEIETILGRIETDLQNVTTAEDLETFRTNLITELLDPETGLPSMGIDEDELGDALEPITDAIGNKDEGTGLYGYISGIRDDIVQNYIGEPKYGVDADGNPTIVGGTGLYGVMFGIDAGNDAALEAFIGTAPTKDADGNIVEGTGSGLLLTLAQQGTAIEDLPAEVERIVGTPTTNENGEVIGGTGLYGEMVDLGIDVGRIEGLIGNPEDGNGLYGVIGTPATDDTPGTGLYGYIDTAVQDLATVADVERIVGVPDIDEETGELTDKSTGLYLDFYNAGVDYDTVIGLIGVPDDPSTPDVNEGRGLFGYVGQSSQDLEDYIDRTFGAVPGQVTEIQGDVNTLVEYVGSPGADVDDPNTPEDETLPTGLYRTLFNQGVAIDAIPGIIEGIVGVPEFGVDDDGNPTTEIVGGTGLYGEVVNLNTDVNTVIASINDTVIPEITSISGFLGTPGAAVDDPNTEIDETLPTGLFATIEANRAAGETERDAIIDAINTFTSDGQYTIEQVLTAIGDSNTDLKNFIGSPGADVDDPNTPEDETLPTGIYEGIATSEGVITDAIATSEENTTAYLDYISQIIGVPATELTQEDIDTVVGLIGEDEAITELNNDNRLYDVNFDGIINDADIGILQGYIDVGVEGVGEIPATGLYLDAANRDLELRGFLNDQEEITRGLISSEADTTRGLMGAATFFNALMGAGDLSGTRVDVSTPDPARINYIYDFEDVFATPQQKSLFPSPYGKPQMAQQQQMAQRQSSTSGPLQIGGMAQGGKVDYDFTDEIMQIMRYGDS